MPAKKYLPHYTYQDYLQWEGRWELIEGIPFAMSPAPSLRHQRINGRLFRFFDEALDPCTTCIASLSIDWKIEENTVVQPDMLVYCHEELGQYLESAPELIIEILSPSTAHKDRNFKYELYQQQGVGYYLIVNPLEETVEIYELKEGGYVPVKVIEKKDASSTYSFTLKDCNAEVDFGKIW